MREIVSWALIVLITVLSGCVLLYNAWGPVLIVASSFFCVLYFCYSLIVNDSLLSPHTFRALNFLRKAAILLRDLLKEVALQLSRQSHEFWRSANINLRDKFQVIMQRRRSNYQLSSDVGSNSRDTPIRFALLEELSPIPRIGHRRTIFSEAENGNSVYEEPGSYNKITSTPLVALKNKDRARNGDVEVQTTSQTKWKRSPAQSPNYSFNQTENLTYFTPNGSPWGQSISPQMRSKASGMKTVQTIAGPLLASTRYNIDAKIYTDAMSPGLTTRLNKYATEASTKLTHQFQYGTGQFPRVNLNAAPVPLLHTKVIKKRTPNTVRVVPPETGKYLAPDKQQILAAVVRGDTKLTPNIREMSLKRHVSKDDIASEVIKKQRTDILSDDHENYEEGKAKRSRDDSKSEEEASPQNVSMRPAKRTKTPSCYDIINSLSSSINVNTGLKRKAVPDDNLFNETSTFGKHFKSHDARQSTPESDAEKVTQKEQNSVETSTNLSNSDKNRSFSLQKVSPNKILKPIKETLSKLTNENLKTPTTSKAQNSNVPLKESQEFGASFKKSIELTDKLFMKVEPRINSELKSLISEHVNLKPKFASETVEEIRKEDITNMRKTSMKARLQSMFDAISGKPPSKINPDIVIQAEEVTVDPKVSTSTTSQISLNSFTTTTTVNTSPIVTSAISPTPTTQQDSKEKHVTFKLPMATRAELAVSTSSGLPAPKTVTASINPEKSTSSTALTAPSSNLTSQTVNVPKISETSQFRFGSSKTDAVPKSQITNSFSFPVTSTASSQSPSLPSNTVTGTPSTSALLNSTPPSSTGANKPSISSTSIFAGFGSNTGQATKSPTTITFGSVTSTSTTSASPASASSSLGFTMSSTPSVASTQLSRNNLTATTTTTTAATAAVTTAITASTTIAATTATSSTSLFGTAADASKTGLFSFGAKTTQPQATKSELFTFGATSNNQNSGFGAKSPITTASLAKTSSVTSESKTMTVASTIPAFGKTTTSTPTFGKIVSSSSSFGSSPSFTFGSNTSANKPTFSFDSGASAAAKEEKQKTVPTFGMNIGNNNQQAPTFGTSTTTANAQAPAVFGSPSTGTNTQAPAFGAISTTTNSQAPVFGAPATSTNTQASGFGTSTANNQSKVPSFGTPANTNNLTITFGASSASSGTQVPSFTTPATTTQQFGSTANSIFGSASNNLFGSTNFDPSKTTTASTTATVFGTSTQGASTIAPMFGLTTPSVSTAAAPVFGSSTLGTSITTSPTFGSTNQGASTTAAPVFGSAIQGIAAATTASSVFGSATQGPTFGTTSTTTTGIPSLFSNSNTSTIANTTTASGTLFSQQGGSSIFGQAKSPTFGSTTTFGSGTSMFGAQTTAPSFGSTTTAATTTAPSFGSSSTPTFGASNITPAATSASPVFGASTSTFGANNAAIPAFGSSMPSAGFGSPTNTFNPQNTSVTFGKSSGGFGDSANSPFAAQQATSTPAFGTSAPPPPPPTNTGFGMNKSASFSFGSNIPTPASAPFTFGAGNNNNNNGSGATPFQFGGNATKSAPAGFNFTAPSTTPNISFGTTNAPTFNAPTPGMFSIGSGSTAPRSRSTRLKKTR